MSRVKPARALKKEPRRAILVFGESQYDRIAIVVLVGGTVSSELFSVKPMREPLVLIKNSPLPTARSHADRIAAVARAAEAGFPIAAIVAHEDCDAIEPSHVAISNKIESTLGAAGCPGVIIAATPAWEIEAWWLLFPEAVAKVASSWQCPDGWLGRNVGVVPNAKEQLGKSVLPKGKIQPASRRYSESDSEVIARNIVELELLGEFNGDYRTSPGKAGSSVRTKSESFGRFIEKIRQLR